MRTDQVNKIRDIKTQDDVNIFIQSWVKRAHKLIKIFTDNNNPVDTRNKAKRIYDELSRRIKSLSILKEIIEEHNEKIESTTDNIDNETNDMIRLPDMRFPYGFFNLYQSRLHESLSLIEKEKQEVLNIIGKDKYEAYQDDIIGILFSNIHLSTSLKTGLTIEEAIKFHKR